MGKAKMGFIGGGFIGPVHADGIGLLWRIATPYAMADDDPAKQRLAKEWGLKAYSSAEAMIADPEVDTVHITGPDQFHKQWALESMAAKKKVVVIEKPMTTNLEDSEAVLEAAQKFERDTGGVVMTNINYMGHALPRAARELRLMGKTGDPNIVYASYQQDWLMANIWNWRLDGEMCASKDILPHLVSAAYFMGGVYPTKLIAQSKNFKPYRDKPVEGRGDAFAGGEAGKTKKTRVLSDLYTSVLCEMNNGAMGNFMVTQYMPGRDNFWEISIGCDKKRITWNQTDPNVMEYGQWMNPVPNQKRPFEPGEVGNVRIINNPGRLTAMGCTDAAGYSPYPGEHPAGHIDAFARNFLTAYRVAMGDLPRKQAVIPGVVIGHICDVVADAVLRSTKSEGYITPEYMVDLVTQKPL
ncbi:MAG: Gfo/Idh/MocA family oxidoreductase [Candidatus Woesearchaeota archaeon]